MGNEHAAFGRLIDGVGAYISDGKLGKLPELRRLYHDAEREYRKASTTNETIAELQATTGLPPGAAAHIESQEAKIGGLVEALTEIDAMPYYGVPVQSHHVDSLVKRFNKALNIARAALKDAQP